MNTELIKPVVPMVPKYYYVVHTHGLLRNGYVYLGEISSWHRTIKAALKAQKILGRKGLFMTAVYGTDFLIHDSEYLAECYGGAAPEWRSPVLMGEGKCNHLASV